MLRSGVRGCHRRLIADYLVMIEGISVYNIIERRDCPRPYELTSFAHRHSEEVLVVYPN